MRGVGVRLPLTARDVPTRLVTGAYILHAGLGKWHGDAQQAAGVHSMAAGAYPFLRKIPPTTSLRLLAAAEITTGTLLLTPLYRTGSPGPRSAPSPADWSPCTYAPRRCTTRAASGPARPGSASARTSGC
jgi:hypothetical protein